MQSEWKNFVVAVRLIYTKRLGDPMTPEADKQKMYKVIVLQHNMAQGKESDTRLQIMPDTQNFVGDRAENRKTVERFGKSMNYRARKRQVLNSIAGEIGKL